MLGFWLIAGAMTLVAVAFVAARLVFPRRASFHAQPREANLAALRSAWAELERDRAAGLLPRDQFETARAELARRAEEELDEAPVAAAGHPSRAVAALAGLLIPIAAFAVYWQVGSPEAIDHSRAFARLEGPLTPDRLPAFRDQLERHLAANPGDARAWAILGRIDLDLGRYGSAAEAFGRALGSSRKVAGDPEVWVDYAEAVGMAEGRTLVGKPAKFIARALELDPGNARALEMAGSLAAEQGDHAGAARHWKLLLDSLAPEDPRRPDLARAVDRAERLSAAAAAKS
jgi:cytochrome c-type biogenesis protein CcmH